MTFPPLLYVARHGETDWNAEFRLQGQADIDINATGRGQADRNGARLKDLIGDAAGFDFVASPMRRTRETMERIRRAMDLDPTGYRTDSRLVEVHFGDWQGHTYAELEALWPGCTAARRRDKWGFRPPGDAGESYAMLSTRVAAWLREVERPTVLVTHGGVIRVLFRLSGLDEVAAARLDVPQDRILLAADGKLEWL